jgi:hypothetical protein
VTSDTTAIEQAPERRPATRPAAGGASFVRSGALAWIPTWPLISTRLLDLRKRRGLMIAVAILIFAVPVLVLLLRLLFHAFDPKSYGPAGSPSIFTGIVGAMAEFGFIAAATVGATAGSTDLSEGMFRHLVITGRSRLALYFARIPSGLAIVLPAIAVMFTLLCLVTCYAGIPNPKSINVNGASLPLGLNEAQLKTWLVQHPNQAEQAFTGGPVGVKIIGPPGSKISGPPPFKPTRADVGAIYANYVSGFNQLNPPINEMAKIGAWLLLELGIGFVVGLGLGSLIGQRTVTIILMVALELVVTPLLGATVIPYFLDGQRVFVGIAMDQLRPEYISAFNATTRGPGHRVAGGGELNIPPMPTWAMITVILGWIVGWTGIGARRMVTRDA